MATTKNKQKWEKCELNTTTKYLINFLFARVERTLLRAFWLTSTLNKFFHNSLNIVRSLAQRWYATDFRWSSSRAGRSSRKSEKHVRHWMILGRYKFSSLQSQYFARLMRWNLPIKNTQRKTFPLISSQKRKFPFFSSRCCVIIRCCMLANDRTSSDEIVSKKVQGDEREHELSSSMLLFFARRSLLCASATFRLPPSHPHHQNMNISSLWHLASWQIILNRRRGRGSANDLDFHSLSRWSSRAKENWGKTSFRALTTALACC